MSKLIPFKVKRLSDNAILPTKNTAADAGIDIYTNETYTLQPQETHLLSTGIAVEIPTGYVALLWDRSSLGSKGIHRLAGVIDSGYRGEWKVALLNTTAQPFEVRAGDKIVQCVIQEFTPTQIEEVSTLSSTERAEAGFGSSGR